MEPDGAPPPFLLSPSPVRLTETSPVLCLGGGGVSPGVTTATRLNLDELVLLPGVLNEGETYLFSLTATNRCVVLEAVGVALSRMRELSLHLSPTSMASTAWLQSCLFPFQLCSALLYSALLCSALLYSALFCSCSVRPPSRALL